MGEVFNYGPVTLFPGVTVHLRTLVMSWIAMGIIILAAAVAVRRLSEVPSGWQNLVEWVLETLERLLGENATPAARGSFAFIATLFLFIVVCNLLTFIPGLKSPTADINVPLGLALAVLGASVYYGAQARGFKAYLAGFLKPNPLFLPLNILELVTRTLTLAFRLFGNMFAGDVLIVIFARLVSVVVPALGMLFHGLIGLLQAYLFVMLSVAYISAATEGH